MFNGKNISRKNCLALIYRIICFVLIASGVFFHEGSFLGKESLGLLMYYTRQSNILALVLFGLLIFKSLQDLKVNKTLTQTSYFPRLGMIINIDILLTLMVYWFFLAPVSAKNPGGLANILSYENFMVHLFAPVFCFVDYFLFQEKGKGEKKDILLSLIFPFFYVIFSSICGFSGYVFRVNLDGTLDHFPYYFYDWYVVGAVGIIYILLVLAFLILAAFGSYKLDKKLGSKKIKSTESIS